MNEQVKTIKDIAKILNISPSTVSRVLNKKGYYSKDIEKKIMEIVETSGFVYNMSAKSLRNAKSYTIGLMIPDISNSFFSNMALIIEEYFNELGYSLYICNTHTDPEQEYRHFNHFASNKVDGILCVSQMTKIPANFERHNIPIVSMDRYAICEMPVTRIISDDYQMSYEVAEQLAELNCKHILLVNGTDAHYVAHKNSISRISGFKDGLKKHGISLDKDHVVYVDLSNDNAIFEAEEAVSMCISKGIQFDGIFAVTDRFALGALYALTNANIKVPDEVKIIGYDNSIYAMISRPSITSVDRNLKEMALTACDKLIELIDSECKFDNTTIIIPSSIIHRDTTKNVK